MERAIHDFDPATGEMRQYVMTLSVAEEAAVMAERARAQTEGQVKVKAAILHKYAAMISALAELTGRPVAEVSAIVLRHYAAP